MGNIFPDPCGSYECGGYICDDEDDDVKKDKKKALEGKEMVDLKDKTKYVHEKEHKNTFADGYSNIKSADSGVDSSSKRNKNRKKQTDEQKTYLGESVNETSGGSYSSEVPEANHKPDSVLMPRLNEKTSLHHLMDKQQKEGKHGLRVTRSSSHGINISGRHYTNESTDSESSATNKSSDICAPPHSQNKMKNKKSGNIKNKGLKHYN